MRGFFILFVLFDFYFLFFSDIGERGRPWRAGCIHTRSGGKDYRSKKERKKETKNYKMMACCFVAIPMSSVVCCGQVKSSVFVCGLWTHCFVIHISLSQGFNWLIVTVVGWYSSIILCTVREEVRKGCSFGASNV